jgi:hypothetical protein
VRHTPLAGLVLAGIAMRRRGADATHIERS